MKTYPLKAYDLGISKAWKLYRLFPRFHNLEYKMLQTIQSMHIPPEQLAVMSVYDYSDILYRTFRKSEKSPDAHLFLGARQAFVKDVFKKIEPQIRAPASSERAYFHEPPNLPNEAVFRPLGPLLRADVTAALIPALK